MSEFIELKKELYQLALKGINMRIDQAKKALTDLKEAVGSESKSTAGDKHETGRAMIHLEQEKVSRQMQNSLNIRKAIDRLDSESRVEIVALGSLVITDKICFYVMAALGQFTLQDQKYYFVSLNSEIVQAFLGAKEGHKIDFKGQTYNVLKIV